MPERSNRRREKQRLKRQRGRAERSASRREGSAKIGPTLAEQAEHDSLACNQHTRECNAQHSKRKAKKDTPSLSRLAPAKTDRRRQRPLRSTNGFEGHYTPPPN